MCNPDVMIPSEVQSVSRSVLFSFWIFITFHFFLVGSSTVFLALTCRALFPSSVSCFHIRACADFHLVLPKELRFFHWPSVTPSSRSSPQLLLTFKISFVLTAKLFAFVPSQTPLPLAMPTQLFSLAIHLCAQSLVLSADFPFAPPSAPQQPFPSKKVFQLVHIAYLHIFSFAVLPSSAFFSLHLSCHTDFENGLEQSGAPYSYNALWIISNWTIHPELLGAHLMGCPRYFQVALRTVKCFITAVQLLLGWSRTSSRTQCRDSFDFLAKSSHLCNRVDNIA